MKARRIYRYFFLPLAFVLLFAQQVGAAHALGHALLDLQQQQADKHAAHSKACEKCADYAQLGNALGVSALDFMPPRVSAAAIPYNTVAFRSIHLLAAVARGPPALLTKIA